MISAAHPLWEKILELERRCNQESPSIYPQPFDKNEAYQTACAQAVTIDGFWAEFGVHRGRSITHLASATQNVVYGFDSFEGLPENWEGHNLKKGDFSLNGQIPAGSIIGDSLWHYDSSPTPIVSPWLPNIRFVKGWFNDTLPAFITRPDIKNNPAAFLHIDCDLYSSTQTIFKYLGDKIVAGTVLAFDELYGYAGWQQHEAFAFAEFLEETGRKYEPIYRVSGPGMTQACVRIVE